MLTDYKLVNMNKRIYSNSPFISGIFTSNMLLLISNFNSNISPLLVICSFKNIIPRENKCTNTGKCAWHQIPFTILKDNI